VAEGIVHAADSGARVINLSLGCDCEVQRVIEEALAYAARRDVVVVAAAGNDGQDYLHYPASSHWTIAVGALNRKLELANFSSYGPGLDLVAPGVDVVSLFRDGESCTGSGTSMATPHVAGVVGLVRSLNPGLDREEIRALLRGEAKDLGAPGYDIVFGAGLVDALEVVKAANVSPGGGNCTSNATSLCLGNGRFQVETFWRQPDGAAGKGLAVRLTPDTGYFWFFRNSNVETVVKTLDACGINGRFWVFAGGLTDVEVRTRVTDTATGEVKEYFNPQGTAFQPIQDTNAFATCGTGAASKNSRAAPASTPQASREALKQFLPQHPVSTLKSDLRTIFSEGADELGIDRIERHEGGGLENRIGSPTCVETLTGMCLNGGRFLVEADWRLRGGETGTGRVVRLTDDTAYFWFFGSANVEAFVKVLNACGINSRFWVFAGGLTDVEVRLRITDMVTGRIKQYVNPLGTAFRPIQDTSTFSNCP
jgi:hypothetical protein